MTKAAKAEERNIGDTLDALGIDMDADPSEAAQDAAEEAAATSVVVEPVEAAPDELIEAAPAVVRIPPPAAAQEPEEVVTPLPVMEPVLVPAPKPQRGKQRPNAAPKMGKGITEKVPGAEKVKVFKREKGRRWFIDDYTKDDLALFPDFESFLTRYVKDDHGPGEYDLVGVDARNNEMELGQVRLRASNKKSPDNSAMDVVQQMLAQQQDRDKEYLERMKEMNTPQPTQDPLELLKGVMDLNERVNGKAGAAEKDAAAAANGGMEAMVQMMSSSGDQSMKMMMMMMQQQQQASDRQMQMMMGVLSKPKEDDPMMKMMMLKLFEDKKDESSGGLPVPPPPSNGGGSTVELITALAGFMGAMGGGGADPGEDDFKEFLKQMLVSKQSDGLSTKEAIELLMKKDEKPGTDDFRSAVDNMAAIMNIANNVNRQQESGPAAGLFDALGALFANRDFAGSIANTIRAKADQGKNVQANGLQAQEQRLAMQQRLLQRQQQQAQMQAHQAAAAQAAAAQGIPPQPMVGQPPLQQVVPTAGHTVPQGVPPGTPAVAPVPQEAQRAAEEQATERKLPQLPANTYEHVNALAEAKDEAELVSRTVTMLIYFSEFADWRGFTEQLLGFVRDGNKEGTLEYLSAFFEGLVAIHLIDPVLSKRVIAGVGSHFAVIRSQLGDFPLEGDDTITGDDLLGDEGDDDLGEGDDDLGEGDDDPGEDTGGDGDAGGDDAPA